MLKYFTGKKNDSGELIREPVSKKWREDTLAHYSMKQKRYNSFENEWDCCTDFGSDDDSDGDDDDDGDPSFIVHTAEIDDVHAPYRPANAALSPISDPHENDAEWLPVLPDEGDPCEDEILQFAHTYLGSTLPEPLPSFIPRIELSHRKTVLKMIGMSCSTATDVYHRPRALLALDFVRRLFSKEDVSSEEWDLSRSNRAFIGFSHRFSAIRRLSSKTGTVFMFDFGTGSSQKWKLATITAKHALMICRLDPQMREDEIAHFLVTRGIPFRTLQASNTLLRTPPRNTHPPSRPHAVLWAINLLCRITMPTLFNTAAFY